MGIVFLTVFLDIVGFAVIFPLFPSMLEHYVELEGADSAIGQLATWLGTIASADSNAVQTLFGGLLGSVYGLLQFVFATIWGGLSDRTGRRPTLLLTLTGTVCACVLWVFAGSFMILVAARILGGIMAGNISTASAAVADTTSSKDRAKGMGMVGMAIGLGFILGPALGGFLAGWRLDSGSTATFALNPFSGPAIASALLAIINLVWVWKRFPETLPQDRRAKSETRSLNPLSRLKSLNLPGIATTNTLYLVYLTAFAGVEFTLSFLAVGRFNFSHQELAWMFVFVGLIIAFVQGGIVRRAAPRFGERAVARAGMLLTMPGFYMMGEAGTVGELYGGLAFMAVGSALVMPCLSALVSRYAPADRQGLALGTFRSMGSLGRALGPIIGAGIYWKLGSSAPYLGGAVVILIPLLMTLSLPAPTDFEEKEMA